MQRVSAHTQVSVLVTSVLTWRGAFAVNKNPAQKLGVVAHTFNLITLVRDSRISEVRLDYVGSSRPGRAIKGDSISNISNCYELVPTFNQISVSAPAPAVFRIPLCLRYRLSPSTFPGILDDPEMCEDHEQSAYLV